MAPTASNLSPDSAQWGREQARKQAETEAQRRRQEQEDAVLGSMNRAGLDRIAKTQEVQRKEIERLNETVKRLTLITDGLVDTVEYLKSTKPEVSQKP